MALYIKRVQTVVSLQQLADTEAQASDHQLADDAPVSGIAGSRIPKYHYATGASPKIPRLGSNNSLMQVPDVDDGSGSSSDDDARSSSGSFLDAQEVPQRSLLDNIILALWQEREEMGLFRYDVTACPTKVVPGIYGFVSQLNEGRATKKRPTEFRVDQVVQAFDPNKFNFNKAFVREVLFTFEPSSPGHTSTFQEGGRCPTSPNLVIINVSPIEYGHILLCPRLLDNLPQLMDPSTVLTALHFALEVDNPYMRVGYNSLGAFATINHLHFQAYYLNAPLPCERAPTTLLKGLKRSRDGVRISRTSHYPVRAFVVEGDSLQAMADVVGQAALVMQAANIPHNMLISDSGSRVFLFPQCYAEKQARGEVDPELLATGVNPACWEIAGHMVFKSQEDYEEVTQDLAWRLLEEVSLSEERFLEVAQLCFGAPPAANLSRFATAPGTCGAAAAVAGVAPGLGGLMPEDEEMGVGLMFKAGVAESLELPVAAAI